VILGRGHGLVLRPERHGCDDRINEGADSDWIPLTLGAVRPTQWQDTGRDARSLGSQSLKPASRYSDFMRSDHPFP